MTEKLTVLIRQVRVLDPLSSTDTIADVLIEEGIIKAISPQLESNVTIIAGKGLILAPGLVDLYSSSGEPGHEERETLPSLLAAATAGGFTRLAILPNTIPPLDNPGAIQALKQRHQTLNNPTRLYFWGALTQNRAGEKMTELGDLMQAGVIGFSDGRSLENLAVLRRILEYIQPFQKPIALVPALASLQGKGVMREGNDSIRYGLPGNPSLTEITALAAILEMVAMIQTPVHIMRVSTARGVELIAEAKSRGVPLTASVSWIHLLLDTQALASYNPQLRLEPPLGNPEDRLALIAGVKNGTLDAIAIDHTPYTFEEKTLAFAEAPPGTLGLELALPLLWEHLVNGGELTPRELWQALSSNPLKCLQETPLGCSVGQKAELILFNPQLTWTVGRDSIHSLSQNTPWWGQSITGKVVQTLLY